MTSRLGRWATTSARVTLGAGVAAVAVVGAVTAIAAPWPSMTSVPVAVDAAPSPSAVTVACAGPLLSLSGVVTQGGDAAVVADQQLVSTAGTDAGVLAADGGATTAAFTAAPVDGVRAALAAAGSASADSENLRGYAASACRPPLMDSWLVAGATTTGSSDLILLANPGAVAATVQLTVFGAAGPQSTPGGTDRVVPAGSQLAVPLAGLVSNEESPVVRVTATGAPVTATLQSGIVRVLDAGGVDQTGAVAAASERQVIPGVSVTVDPAAASPGPATILRLLAPGADTTAEVEVRGGDGSPSAAPATVQLRAGVPAELELGSLPVGNHTIVVTADAPVVAGAWATTGFAAGADFAWYAAAPEIVLPTPFAVPAGEGATLTVVNTGAQDAAVSLTASDGTIEQLGLAAGSLVERPVQAGTTYTLDPSAPVAAAVSFQAPGALAGFPVWGVDAAAPPIRIYP